jgi:hypothetical protein
MNYLTKAFGSSELTKRLVRDLSHLKTEDATNSHGTKRNRSFRPVVMSKVFINEKLETNQQT